MFGQASAFVPSGVPLAQAAASCCGRDVVMKQAGNRYRDGNRDSAIKGYLSLNQD